MKILIMIMCSKQQHFKNQANCLKTCYSEIINKLNLQNYIKVVSYIGDNEKQYIDNDTIFCISDDSSKGMYEKTLEAFDVANKNFEYDYIVRTNNSQFINIDLLYNFLNNKEYDDTSYTGMFYSIKETTLFNSYDISMIGNFMIFPKTVVDKLIENKDIIYDLRKTNANIATYGGNDGWDDVTLSTMLIYLYKQTNDLTDYKNYLSTYLEKVKGVGFGFYKCWDRNKPYEGTELCKYHNESLHFNYMKHFMSFRLKSNTSPHEDVSQKILELSKLFLNNKDNDINETIKFIYKYMRNPHVDVGWWEPHIYIKLKDVILYNEIRKNRLK